MIAQNQMLFSQMSVKPKWHQHICNLVRIRPSKRHCLAAGARAICSPYEWIWTDWPTNSWNSWCKDFLSDYYWVLSPLCHRIPLKSLETRFLKTRIGKVRASCAVLPSCCDIRPAGDRDLDASTFRVGSLWFEIVPIVQCIQVCYGLMIFHGFVVSTCVNLHWGVCGNFFLCGASTRSWSSASLKHHVFLLWTCDFFWDTVTSDFQTPLDSLWLVALHPSFWCELLFEGFHREDLNAARSWPIWGTILRAARQEAKDLEEAKQTKDPIKVYTNKLLVLYIHV